MPREPGRWTVEGFLERFDIWAAEQSPGPDGELAVMHWIHALLDDPYPRLARRVGGFDGLWECAVPGTLTGGQVVLVSYLVREFELTVRCNEIATLPWPV